MNRLVNRAKKNEIFSTSFQKVPSPLSNKIQPCGFFLFSSEGMGAQKFAAVFSKTPFSRKYESLSRKIIKNAKKRRI